MTVMSAMAGAGAGALLVFSNGTYTFTSIAPLGAQSSISLNANGSVTVVDDLASTKPNWCTPGALASLYEVMATLTSGTNPSTGTMGAWLALGGADLAWTCFKSGTVGGKNSVFRLDIRRIGTTTVLATGIINLTATVN